MIHGMRTILLISLILCVATGAFAVASTIAFKGGVSRAEGDITEEKQIDGMIGLSYEIWMAKWLSLGIHPYISRLQAGVKGTVPNFKSDVIGGDLLLRLRPFTLYFDKAAQSGIAPYLIGGAGVVNFYPKDLDGNPLGGDPDSDYPYTSLVAPAVGGGLSILTGTGVDFDLGVQYQMLQSDYLDGWIIDDDDDAFWLAYLGISHTFGLKKPAAPVIQIAPEVEKIKPFLTVRQNKFNVSPAEGKITDAIISNTDWTTTKDAEWLSVYPTNGNGDYTFDISYTGNPAFQTRTGNVIIRGGGLSQTITITQEAGRTEPFLSVAERTRYVNYESGEVTYSVKANVPWTVTENETWLSVTPMSGNNEGILTVKYNGNSARKYRSGQIVVEGKGMNQTLTVIQDRVKPDAIVKDKPVILTGVRFKSGSSTIEKVSFDILDEMVASMIYYPEMTVEIQGHTDSTGSLQINNKLSQARADAVKNYLISKGVAPGRMTAKGYGPDKPIATNSTPDGRAQNRRIEFVRTN